MGSFCDQCESPGHCCKRLSLNPGSDMNAIEVDEKTLVDWVEFNIGKNPFYLIGHNGDDYEWGCYNLNSITGRCNDYENRPQLCRDYEPKSDRLCYHYEEYLDG